jgi:uncharacterized protein YdhG (YjbR/CyaY superfamily)
MRTTIRKAAPGAQEVISYKMPTYTLYGNRLLYFRLLYFACGSSTAQSTPPLREVVAAFHDEHASCDKGTVRFPLSEPVKLIGRIAKFRTKEIAESLPGTTSNGRIHMSQLSPTRRTTQGALIPQETAASELPQCQSQK